MPNLSETQELVQKARSGFNSGDFKNAAALYEEAARLYISQGDDLTGAEMLNNSSVSLLQTGKHDDQISALRLAKGTDEIFAKAGDLKSQAMAIGNQASALDALKKYAEATILYQQAADIFTNLGENELLSYILKNQALVFFRQGKIIQAAYKMHTVFIAIKSFRHLSIGESLYKMLLDIPINLLH
jgi:tetratricopeptide (TPR) repeat protein